MKHAEAIYRQKDIDAKAPQRMSSVDEYLCAGRMELHNLILTHDPQWARALNRRSLDVDMALPSEVASDKLRKHADEFMKGTVEYLNTLSTEEGIDQHVQAIKRRRASL